VKQTLDSSVNFVDYNPQYNKYYLMLREMRQDVVREQYKIGTKTKLNSMAWVRKRTIPTDWATAACQRS
jgi:hypothetical protein